MSSPFLNKKTDERNVKTMGRGIIIGNDAYRIKRLEDRIAELEETRTQTVYEIAYDPAGEIVSMGSTTTENPYNVTYSAVNEEVTLSTFAS